MAHARVGCIRGVRARIVVEELSEPGKRLPRHDDGGPLPAQRPRTRHPISACPCTQALHKQPPRRRPRKRSRKEAADREEQLCGGGLRCSGDLLRLLGSTAAFQEAARCRHCVCKPIPALPAAAVHAVT